MFGRTLLLAATVGALASCDSGYQLTIHSPCDRQLEVDFLADQSDLPTSGIDVQRTVEIVPANCDNAYGVLDGDDSAIGILLMSGPRSGDVIRSFENRVIIPRDACPT
jgi:hypothetical protein